jgi:phenylalanine-4-hydroxylase
MSTYESRLPDRSGNIAYTDEEHHTWSVLITRQLDVVKNRASKDYLRGISLLELSSTAIPQLKDITQRLNHITGWSVKQVRSIIKPIEFFKMLSQKQFPVATFIRRIEELDYLKEPDIFHEIFGHCPMICHQAFSDFMMHYGEKAILAPKELHKYYARLFWFTVEFGLIEESNEIKCYGGGILSSKQETIFAHEDKRPQRVQFELLEVLRTQYRYDKIQPKYFVIQSYNQLYDLIRDNLDSVMTEALRLGDLPTTEISDDSASEWVTC